ncbi:MAG: DUF255 domain-containing protein [Fimbriimonadales bacterium]
MNRQIPAFKVLANLLAVFFVAGFCIRFLTRYLPENQPNRLGQEYGSYVKQASRQHIDWFPFSDTAFAKAKAENKLIFLELGNSFSRSSNVMTKNHFNNAELARLLNNHFVSIRADMNEMPWIADQIDLNGIEILRSQSSLIFVLTPDGLIFQRTTFLPLFTSGRKFGLLDWLGGVARQWVRDPETMLAQSSAIQLQRVKSARSILAAGAVSPSDADEFESSLCDALEAGDGEFKDQLTPISSAFSAILLESKNARSREAALKYLLRLRESSCYDQLLSGVFFAPSLPRLSSPNVGKDFGMNALIALEFAKAGVSGYPLFTRTAEQIAAMLIQSRRSDTGFLFETGIESDEHPVKGTTYYAFPSSLDSASHLSELVPDDSSVGSPVAMLSKSSSTEVGASRERSESIERDRVLIISQRDELTAPPFDTGVYADKNGQIISALFQLSAILGDRRLLEAAETAYDVAMQTFVQPLGDCMHAPTGRGRTTGYCADYLWLARAAIERYAATGEPSALNQAIHIMTRCHELFATEQGPYLSTLGSTMRFAPFAATSLPCADGAVESANALAARNWFELGQINSSDQFTNHGRQILESVRGSLPGLSWTAAGLVRAGSRLFAEYVLAYNVPVENIAALRAAMPTTSIWPAQTGDRRLSKKPAGYYIVRDGSVSGPLSKAEIISATAN